VVGDGIGMGERVAGMDATGRGAQRAGDPTDILSSEAVEKDKMQMDLLKEQKRLELLVKNQQQQLSSLQSQLMQQGPAATAAARPRPVPANHTAAHSPANNGATLGSPAQAVAGQRPSPEGYAGDVGDVQGEAGGGRYYGRQAEAPAEWGSAVGPLVLPHDLKYLEATGLSRPVSAAVHDWTGLQGAGEARGERQAKAGRRQAPHEQDHARMPGREAARAADLQHGGPPPPHPRARSAGGPSSRGSAGLGARRDDAGPAWNAVELSLDSGGFSPAQTLSLEKPSRSLPPSRGGGRFVGGDTLAEDPQMEPTGVDGLGGLHVARALRNTTPDEFEKSLAGASAFVAPDGVVPFLQDGLGRAPAGARGLRTPKSLARAREIGSQGAGAGVAKFHGDEPWDKSMVGASELVLPPPHPRAIVGVEGDGSGSRPASAASVASIGSSLGSKHMPSPSHFDALNKRRLSKLAGLQHELDDYSRR
jgi:hypothetical protein